MPPTTTQLLDRKGFIYLYHSPVNDSSRSTSNHHHGTLSKHRRAHGITSSMNHKTEIEYVINTGKEEGGDI